MGEREGEELGGYQASDVAELSCYARTCAKKNKDRIRRARGPEAHERDAEMRQGAGMQVAGRRCPCEA